MEGQYIALVRSIKKKKSFEMPIYPTRCPSTPRAS